MQTLADRIRKKMVQAISDHQMIAEGDRVLVAVSGGKDSTAMLLLLDEIAKRSAMKFSLHPVILDQKQPGFKVDAFADWLGRRGFNLTVLEEDTFSIVKEKTEPGKAYCGLCSRLRRGIFYTYAKENGFHKIALGHHRDDLNETLLMNMFYSGILSSMPGKLYADDGYNVVIRPLCYVPEEDLVQFSRDEKFPIIPCSLCGSQTGLKRQRVKKLLRELQSEDAHIGAKILAAQQNLRPSQLMDPHFLKKPDMVAD